MPPQSRYRKSVDSPSSPAYAPAFMSPSATGNSSRSDFAKGIGLDFASPEPLSPSISTARSDPAGNPASSHRSSTQMTRTSSRTSSKGTHGASASISSELDHTYKPSGPRAEDDRSDTSPSSVAASIPEGAEFPVPIYAKSHDAVFSHACIRDTDAFGSADIGTGTPRRASLLTPVPMGISRSHQKMIDDSPKKFQRNEAEGLFDSVRGLMADLRFDIGNEQSNNLESAAERTEDKLDRSKHSADAGVSTDLRGWLASSHRSQAGTSRDAPLKPAEVADGDVESTPSIKVAIVETSPSPAGSNENTVDSTTVATQRPPQTKLAPPEPVQPSDSQGGASPRVRGLWGLLRAPSPAFKAATITRSPSASSYSSTSSFIPRSTSPAVVNNASTSSLLSNSSFSLFSRKLTNRSVSETHASSVTPDDEIPLRLSRRQVDEDKLADLIISCADARHILKTDNSPTKLKEVGLKLELGWREQLAEAQQLRSRLEVTQDTVEDLEDENKHLRSQLGSLSEQIVSREEDMRQLGEATATQIARERDAVAVETEAVRAEVALRAASLTKQLAEEKTFALGLGLMLREKEYRSSGLYGLHAFREGSDQDPDSSVGRSMEDSQYGSLADASLAFSSFGKGQGGRPPSVLFDLAGDLDDPTAATADTLSQQLRRSALLQGRPSQTDASNDAFDLGYEELFRCSAHRFAAHGRAAPPSTLVDERVLLVGTDQKLLLALVQKLTALGLTQVLLATPVWSGTSPRATSAAVRSDGVRSISFDISASDAWAALSQAAVKKLGGEIDCVVNAFDQLSVERLVSVSNLLKQQAGQAPARGGGVDPSVASTRQAMSVVNIVYEPQQSASIDADTEKDAETTTCTMALIGLASSLAIQNCTSRAASSQAVRLNTVVLSQSASRPQSGRSRDNEAALEGILRLVDPCSSVQGCVLHSAPGIPLRCLGAPLCPALPPFFSSPNLTSPSLSQTPKTTGLISRFAANDANRRQWLKVHKRVADVELLDGLEKENEALRKRLETLEGSHALLLENRTGQL
ncbi:hypothetical protein NDA16_002497 [Ustilago loliicola]|nr:hypothetical protein NDA16_002497 [Ustilago loliicola]